MKIFINNSWKNDRRKLNEYTRENNILRLIYFKWMYRERARKIENELINNKLV